MTAQAILSRLKNEGKLIKDGYNYKTADGRILLRAYKGRSQTVWVDPDKKCWYPTLLDAYNEDYPSSIAWYKNIVY